MVSRYTKLRLKRSIRQQQQSIEQVGSNANKGFEYHVVRRWRNLRGVQRFVAGWLMLAFLLAGGVYLQTQNLSAYYQTQQPVPGGTYREGVVGEFANLNPIYATTNTDRAGAKLIFSTLFKYDKDGEIIGDLAESWSVNKDGTIYSVVLRKDVKWHDDEDFDSTDVVFTYKTIQNPDVRSILSASWQGIKVQAKDSRTVTFTLPNSFAPFLHSLTEGGIIPEHILASVNPEQMRTSQFNSTAPIGTGPFAFTELADADSTKQLRLRQFQDYHHGMANITQMYLLTYPDQEAMIQAFNRGELAAIGGLKGVDFSVIDANRNHVWYDAPLTNGVYLFMRNGDVKLSDIGLRKALTQATDQVEILKSLNDRFIPVDSPLLKGQLGYNEEFTQAKFDPGKAQKALDELGWKKSSDGWRYKGEEKLTLTIITQDSDNYPKVAEQIKNQWSKVGIQVEVQLVDESLVQSNHIIPHNYQLFLSGIEIGRDPDVFPFWHSSQAEVGGYNLSEYSSDVADMSLESGRTRTNEELRDIKYEPFIQAWAADAPAIGVYQPTYVYVQQTRAKGFEDNSITAPEDRYNDVSNWYINSEVKDIPY